MASKKGIEFSKISAQPDKTSKATVALEEISRVRVPCLSDAIVNRSVGGQAVILMLDKSRGEGIYDRGSMSYSQEDPVWKLRKIVNRDGTRPKEGDEVRVLFARKMTDAAGHQLTNADFEAIRKRGGEGPEKYHVYKLDADLCFECKFADAMQLLTQNGVHYETGMALCEYKKISANGKQNWLYEEVVQGVNDGSKAPEESDQKNTGKRNG